MELNSSRIRLSRVCGVLAAGFLLAVSVVVNGCATFSSDAADDGWIDTQVLGQGIVCKDRALVLVERKGFLEGEGLSLQVYWVVERIDNMLCPRGFQFIALVEPDHRIVAHLRYWGRGDLTCEDDCIVLDVPQQIVDGDGEYVSRIRVTRTGGGKYSFSA